MGVLVLALALAGCGGGSAGGDGPVTGADSAVSDAGASHIHGVGINPADDAVVIATHGGLFRAAPGRQTAERIGDRRQDTMGFTVVGPDRFLGSGHPDPRDDLPPDHVVAAGENGLSGSSDAGRSWRPLDEARVGLLAWTEGRLALVDGGGVVHESTDAGRSWKRVGAVEGRPVAFSGHRDSLLVALADTTIHASDDGGRSWRLRVNGA